MMSSFSVLLSVYCKETPAFLQLALESVFNQSLKPSEVVLVKDGKLTSNLELVIDKFLRKFDTLKVVPLIENMGLGIALQKGLEQCTNEFVIRMDTDDVCDTNRFETQINYLVNNPEVDVVGSNITEFLENPTEPVSARKVPETNNAIYRFAKKRNPMNHMSVAYKKSKVLEVGGYQKMNGFEDYFLWVRMLVAGHQFYNIQEDLIFARVGNDMIGRRIGLEYIKNEKMLFDMFYQLGFLSLFEYCKVLPLRIGVRLMPKSILKLIYKKALR